MGFQGQLSSVSLTDIFQTLQMNRQTGTLSVGSPEGHRYLYFDAGQVAMCDAPPIDGKAFLLHALLRIPESEKDPVGFAQRWLERQVD